MSPDPPPTLSTSASASLPHAHGREVVRVQLPPELQYLIFEQTASIGGRQVAMKLMLVSKAIHDLIKPSLYTIFKQLSWSLSYPNFDFFDSDPPSSSPFPSTPSNNATPPGLSPSSRPTLASLGPYARHLIIGGLKSSARISELISACPNTSNLAIWAPCPLALVLPALERLKALHTLSADFESIAPAEFIACRALRDLRFLDIIGFPGSKDDDWADWGVLAELPNLTHVSLNNPVEPPIVRGLLARCAVLQVLILLDDNLPTWHAATADIADCRLVLMRECRHVNIFEDWMNGARDRLDTWSFARLVSLARRRQLFIDNTQRWVQRPFAWSKHLNEEGLKWFSTLAYSDP